MPPVISYGERLGPGFGDSYVMSSPSTTDCALRGLETIESWSFAARLYRQTTWDLRRRARPWSTTGSLNFVDVSSHHEILMILSSGKESLGFHPLPERRLALALMLLVYISGVNSDTSYMTTAGIIPLLMIEIGLNGRVNGTERSGDPNESLSDTLLLGMILSSLLPLSSDKSILYSDTLVYISNHITYTV